MSWITDLLKTVVSPIANLIDDLTTSDEERLQLKNELLKIENDFNLKAMEIEKTIIDKKAEIMVAELQQNDKFTKRARPAIAYMGLLILLLNHVLLPWVAFFTGHNVPKIDVPTEFWLAWGGVTGMYSFGRTKEKLNGVKK